MGRMNGPRTPARAEDGRGRDFATALVVAAAAIVYILAGILDAAAPLM